jgi:hypothetical protein
MTSPNAEHEDANPLSPEQWARVRAIVEETVALPPNAQSAFLDAACGADHSMRRRIEGLVAAHERADDDWGFPARSAGELAAPLLAADGTTTG